MSKIVSSANSSSSEIIPQINVLLRYFESYIDENDKIIQLKIELGNGLKRKFKQEDIKHFTLTKLLDPS